VLAGQNKTVCCLEDETISTSSAQPSTTLEDFDFDDRLVRVILPAGFKARRTYPLIIHLHGAGIDADFIIDVLGLDKLGLKNEVIVVVPNGSVHPEIEFGFSGQFWNATTACCGFEYAFGPQVDDVDFLTRLLDEVQMRYRIDDDRVYISGESNGGFMAYRMACDLADRIAGIWVVAGATHLEQNDCNPSRPVNVLHMHNAGDPDVLFDGGQLATNPLSTYPGALTTLSYWAAYNDCTGELKEKDKTLDIAQPSDTMISQQQGCPDGVKMELWKVDSDSHPFPDPLLMTKDGLPKVVHEAWKWLSSRGR
jgi:polyhydroxybutyrate depolymerase